MGDAGGQTAHVLDNGNNIDPVWNSFIGQSHLISLPSVSGSGSGSIIKCSSDKFFNSTFATDAVQKSFEISQPIGDSADSLLLGFDSAGDDAIPTSDILSAFDVNSSDLPPLIGAIVTVLNGPIDNVLPKFQIDDSAGSKSGTWIIALNSTTLEVCSISACSHKECGASTTDDEEQIATALTLVMNPLGSGKEIDFGQSVHDSLKTDAGLQVDLSSLKFSSNLPRLRMKHRAIITKADDGTISTGSVFEMIVEIPVSGYLISLKVGTGGRLSVGLLNNGGTFGSLVNLLANGPSESEATPSETGILDNIKLWKVIVKLPGASEFSGNDISFEIGFTVTLHLPGQPVTIGLSYDTRSKTFSGSLLFQTKFLNRLDPNYDDLEDLPPGMLATLVPFYDLAASSPFNSLPKSVPTRLTEAFISYTKTSQGAPYELRFSAAMASTAATTAPGGSVPFPFDWSGISLDYYRRGATNTEGAVNALSVNSTFELHSDSGRFLAGDMSVSFDYIGGGGSPSLWSLSGSARSLQLGAIAKFFDPDLNGEVLDVLGKLSIDSIDVSYTYQQDVATSFLFSGVLTFGDIQLKLYYQYVTAQTASDGTSAAHQAKSTGIDNLAPIDNTNGEVSAWRFDAYLDTVGGAATIGQIADSIVDNASNSLPGFVKDIQVSPTASDHLISIHCGKTTSQTSNGAIERAIFLLSVSISSVEFTIEQLSSGGGSSQSPNTKRLLRVSAGKLPLLSDLPVVKELPQPWQKLQYMWSPASGLTRDEVAALNQQLVLDGSDNKLYFKPATRDDADATATNDPVVLVEGHHFIIVYNDQAVVDHVFGSDSDEQQSGQQGGQQGEQQGGQQSSSDGTGSSTSSEPQEKPPSKGALKLHTGILDITAVSLQYKQGHLYVFIDATLALGPLELSLIGFGIGLNIAGLKLDDLSTLVKGIDFQLHGMEVSFDKPPILIAGCFYHDVTQNGNQTVDAYRGGIAVAIPPYTFVAVGEYAIVTTTQGQFKSVFVFAKLDGPIIDFEFAILRGLRIGFGYNSSVRSPAVEELYQFPLIDNGAVSGAGNHPMAILEKMEGGPNPFVQLKQDNYWLAFGFTISSFDLISATVVALVQFGDAGCIFSLFGDLTISYPPDSPPDVKLFNIEILMMAELNFVDDVFKLEAALAPTSFVLVPYCKLFGGLALYTFFGSSPHAGDWVLSVGGYHRLFDVPAWYPRPSRIGLDFNISIIHIRGEGYFAITPKAIMTGCMIRCELSLGPVYAWLDAAFDAMVQFSPLHYWVSMHVEVGVECNIPVLFCTIHIRISIGAGLDIQGPEFGGTAYVDFWFFSFSFDFGATAQGPPPINLQDFYLLCEKSGPPDTSPNSSATDGLAVKIKMSLEDGSFPMPPEDKNSGAPPDDTGAGTKWFVKGGSFQFRVSSVFAITQAYVETEDSSQRQPDGTTALLGQQDTSKMQQVQPAPSQSKLSSLPMQLSADLAHPDGDGIASKMCVAIQDVDEKGLAIEGFKPSFIDKAMPQTLWADPNHPPDRLTQDKGTVDLPMAVTFSAPDPVLAIAKIPQFNATDMAKECAGGNKIPQLPTVTQQDLLPEALPPTTSTPTQQWASTKQTWSDNSNNNLTLANNLTRLCMTTLGWDKPPPDVLEKAKGANIEPWMVPVAFPSRLVAGTGREAQGIEDGLDSFYLELPRTTVAPVH